MDDNEGDAGELQGRPNPAYGSGVNSNFEGSPNVMGVGSGNAVPSVIKKVS